MDILAAIFGNKQVFTYIIVLLYVANCFYQLIVARDYLWSGYWAAACCITLIAMQLSQRGGS